MRRLFVCAAAALVLLAVAIPAMASSFAFNGELTYGFITDFIAEAPGYGNAFITANAKVDDNNTFTATFATAYQGAAQDVLVDTAGTTATLQAFTAYFSDFHGVSDLGGILGWKAKGFDPVLYFGWTDLTAVTHGVSAYGYEGVAAFDPGAGDTLSMDLNLAKIATLRIDANPHSAGTWASHFLVDAYGTAGPITWSGIYWTNNRSDFMGLMGADLGYSGTFGDFSVGADAQLKYDLANASGWGYGVGVKVGWTSMITVGAGLAGSSTGLGNLGVNVNFVPMAGLGVDLGTSFNLGTPALNGVDVSAWKTLGPGKARLGCLFTKTAGGLLYGPAALSDGGVYLSYDLVF